MFFDFIDIPKDAIGFLKDCMEFIDEVLASFQIISSEFATFLQQSWKRLASVVQSLSSIEIPGNVGKTIGKNIQFTIIRILIRHVICGLHAERR